MLHSVEMATLGEICYITDGAHAKVERKTEGIPYLTSKNIGVGRLLLDNVDYIAKEDYEALFSNTSRAQRRLQDGDILIGIIGTFGNAYLYTQTDSFGVSSAVAVVRPDRKRVFPKYLYYAITSDVFQSAHAAYKSGSVQGYTNIPTIKRLPVPLPPLPEQRAIASILGALDDKIELSRRMNATLEAMARALFQSWFVDFDPVRAKAEGRATDLPEELDALFPDGFEESELGEIPRGWKVCGLDELCSTQYGYTASAESGPVGPKFLRVMDINKQNWIEWEQVPHCVVDLNKKANYSLKIGDIVVARMADPGKSAIIEDNVDAVFASYLVRLQTKSLAESYFVYFYLKSDAYLEYAEGAKSGSVQANMNARVITGTPLPVPSQPLLRPFLAQVVPLRKQISTNVRKTQTLTDLRDTLLPKLISGEVRVPEAERWVESV